MDEVTNTSTRKIKVLKFIAKYIFVAIPVCFIVTSYVFDHYNDNYFLDGVTKIPNDYHALLSIIITIFAIWLCIQVWLIINTILIGDNQKNSLYLEIFLSNIFPFFLFSYWYFACAPNRMDLDIPFTAFYYSKFLIYSTFTVSLLCFIDVLRTVLNSDGEDN